MVFPEAVLFAEDLMKFFMNICQVQWTSGINGQVWNEYPRMFTDAMGNVAWLFSQQQAPPQTFIIQANNMPLFYRGYNHQDFLHYCGMLGFASVIRARNGERNYADGAAIAIFTYLAKIQEDGTFDQAGGWNGLKVYAQWTWQGMSTFPGMSGLPSTSK
ncbi:hypothetical protein HNY73_021052 [Argiope bruennichi]|uniref:Uncharacterized protein n=1 Tax=Argiope bruennichi TaxID=94029 RepID=A0A8T0E8Q5_ARGBR|nr:hypothetical protein HNY73_021052 [Argiope bruennichi]